MPLMVRSPVTRYCWSATCSTEVDWKVISGYWSMSKKSLLRRWASRSALRVSMLAAWTVRLRLELAGFSASKEPEPLNSLNEPRTLVTMA